MKIIDSHAHFEPQILDLPALLFRMKQHGIGMTALMAAITLDPIYKKPEFLMSIQRLMMQTPGLWSVARCVDRWFHGQKGTWSPWYRKLLAQKASYRIAQKPDNRAVFDAIDAHPEQLCGWIFINPLQDGWRQELNNFSGHPGAVGIKVHPFWHRYSIQRASELAQVASELKMPLMVHLGFEDVKNVIQFMKNHTGFPMIFSHAAFPFYQQLWKSITMREDTFVDVSSHHVNGTVLRRAYWALGAERLLFGTDDPYGEPDYGLKMQKWIMSLNLTSSEESLILRDNFIKITSWISDE